MPLPIVFRSGSGNLTFNVDYYDYATGAGYKKFYLAGAGDSVGNKYFLTTDSGLNSDTQNYMAGTGSDIDFDLTFNNPTVIAGAEATISFMTLCSGNDGDTFSVAVTVYHVAVGGAETSIGTVTITDADGDPARKMKRTAKLTLTSKALAIGEKLRINLVITAAGTGAATWKVYFDPAGTISHTAESGGTINSSASINIPFKIDL